jgi:hypothetical protein
LCCKSMTRKKKTASPQQSHSVRDLNKQSTLPRWYKILRSPKQQAKRWKKKFPHQIRRGDNFNRTKNQTWDAQVSKNIRWLGQWKNLSV